MDCDNLEVCEFVLDVGGEGGRRGFDDFCADAVNNVSRKRGIEVSIDSLLSAMTSWNAWSRWTGDDLSALSGNGEMGQTVEDRTF